MDKFLAAANFTGRAVDLIVNYFFGHIFWFRAAALLISAILLTTIIFLNINLNLTAEKITHWMDVIGSAGISKRKSKKTWSQIQARLKIGTPNNLKLAILEADRLLEETLKSKGVFGKNIDEQLEKVKPENLSNLQELREIRKLKSEILADPEFPISEEAAQKAIEVYRKTFIELGLIEG